MSKNIGVIERIFRIVIGLAIIIYGVVELSLLGLIGLVPFMTAMMGWCPLYRMLGVSTCKIKDNNKGEEK